MPSVPRITPARAIHPLTSACIPNGKFESGKILLVGNQQSNQVVTFGVDPDTGKMTPTGAKIEVPG